MTIDTLVVLALVALAFIVGFRAGGAFTRAGHRQDRLVEAFCRDQDVLDAADMEENSNA